MKKITIAVIGLGFGSNFAEIFANHPNVEKVIVVDLNETRVKSFLMNTEYTGKTIAYESFDDVLKDESVDAVHVCTGIDSHAALTIKALNAGKHCACAVPMATKIEDIKAIVESARKNNRKYMMMETQLYGTYLLRTMEMYEKGELGKIQHMRGIHYQPMDDGYWNTEITGPYWQGLPPMHYSTHAIAPLHRVSGSTIESVICVGGGTMSEKLVSNYGNPFPIEDCLLCFENGLKGQVVRGLFECSAKTTESFNIYGSKKTVMTEYNPRIIEKTYDESKYDYAGFVEEHLAPKNYYKRLPKEIQWTTVEQKDGDRISSQEYLESAPLSHHGGSHPHLCHEFISCILENRPSSINEDVAANITAAGICAHISAMNGGEKVIVPNF